MSKKALILKGYFEEKGLVDVPDDKCVCVGVVLPDCTCGCGCCPSVRQKLVLWYPNSGYVKGDKNE